MRKIVLLLIALFTMGGMCKAEEKSYWVTADSYYDCYFGYGDKFDINTPEKRCYPVTINYDGTNVSIKGLVPLNAFYSGWGFTEYAVQGTYDAAKGTITISSPRFNSNKPELKNYTCLYSGTAFGSKRDILLVAGDYEDKQNVDGTYTKVSKDKLVFSIDEAKHTLTSKSGFGAVVYGESSQSIIEDKFDFYKSATMSEISDDAQLEANPSEIKFTGDNVKLGSILKANFVLSNPAKKSNSYTVTTEGSALSLERYDVENYQTMTEDGKIKASSNNYYIVTFTPKEEGAYNGKIIFTAEDGTKTIVPVVADHVSKGKDLSSITKEGDLLFSDGTGSNVTPFELTNDITGFPVVASTCKGDFSSSELNVSFTVPEGQQGVFSWKGVSTCELPCAIFIYQNDEKIYDDMYKISGEAYDDDITNAILLKSGDYTFKFKYSKQMDWNTATDSRDVLTQKPLRAYLYDFSLKTGSQMPFGATQVQDAIDLGNLYVDKFAATATDTVKILNTGMFDINVDNVTNSEHFSVIKPEEGVITGDYLKVPIKFSSSDLYDYEEDVTFTVTGGKTFTVHCKASTEELPTDYTPIVTEGTFSFDTSHRFPFEVTGSSAKSSVEEYEGTEYNRISWLDASFEVPAGKKGIVSWEGHNSSDTWLIAPDRSQVFTDGTSIYIDGKLIKQFNGTDTDASSTQFDENDLTFAPGLHTIRFNYESSQYPGVGSNRFKLSDLALTLEDDATGVAHVNAAIKAGTAEIFSTNGMRLSKLQKGINIVKKNGKVSKMFVK